MCNKIMFLLFIPIALSKIVAEFPKAISFAAKIELPQYGEVEAAGGDFVYMKLDGFKKCDKIYIELSFDIGRPSVDYSLPILYQCTMELAVDDNPKELEANGYSESGTSYTFYYTIELTDDYKYLIFLAPPLKDTSGNKLKVVYKVAHTKGSKVGLILLIVFIVIILIVIVAIVVHCIKKRKANEAYNSSFPNQALTQ